MELNFKPKDLTVAHNTLDGQVRALQHVESSPINNTTESNLSLLKELLMHLTLPVGENKLEFIKKSLLDNGVSGYSGQYHNIITYTESPGLRMNNDILLQASNVEDLVMLQKKKVENADHAFLKIQAELLSDVSRVKYTESQLPVSLAKMHSNTAQGSQEELSTGTSYAEMWRRITAMIGSIKADYVDFYADLMKKYTDMYEAFNKHVQKASSEAVSSGSDGNNVQFDAKKMFEGYEKFVNEVGNIDLGSVKDWALMTPEQQKSMLITLEPAFKVAGDGRIAFNMDLYNEMPKYPPGFNYTPPIGIYPPSTEISTATYQAWLASFNSVANGFQSNMQSFAQRYSQANSTYDNLNKVLSGIISSSGETAKDVLKSLS